MVDRLVRPAWSAPERQHFRYCLAASAFLFLVYSLFSTGYLHPDEHFQTVEFASMKLGITDAADLPWEYRERMRSFLQPAMYVGVSEAAAWVGIHRPTTLLFLFRLLSGLLAWSALWALVVTGRRWVDGEKERRRLYTLAALLWPLPFLGVRTSSETIATSALCLGIVLLEWRAELRNGRGRFGFAVLAGVAFGLCFGFRYSSGVMAAGAGLWYLRLAEKRASLLAGLVLGTVLALTLGVFTDRWGYGTTTFPVYSYLYQNFFLGRAADFGTDPFYAYLYLPLLTPMAPLVLFLLVATLVAWLRRPCSVLTWVTAPYVALLCIAAHKETRFLFPLAPFLPFFVVFALALEPPVGARFASALGWFASGSRLRLGYLLNSCALLGCLLLPLQPEFPVYKLLENESQTARGPIEVVLAHAPNRIPYRRGGSHMAFLEPKNIKWLDSSVADLEAKRSRGETFFALVDLPVPFQEPADWIRSHCAFVESSWPRWLLRYNFFQWQDRSYYWELRRCDHTS